MRDHPQSALQFGVLIMCCVGLSRLDHHPYQFRNEVARALPHLPAELLAAGQDGDYIKHYRLVLDRL